MGYSTRPGTLGHTIQTYWPDDTATEIYLVASLGWSLSDIQTKIEETWPGTLPENIWISSEKIHTDCIGYDLYDAGDYTNFIIISLRA